METIRKPLSSVLGLMAVVVPVGTVSECQWKSVGQNAGRDRTREAAMNVFSLCLPGGIRIARLREAYS